MCILSTSLLIGFSIKVNIVEWLKSVVRINDSNIQDHGLKRFFGQIDIKDLEVTRFNNEYIENLIANLLILKGPTDTIINDVTFEMLTTQVGCILSSLCYSLFTI